MQGKNDGCGRDNGQAGLNCLNVVAEAWAASLQVFLHRRFGERYLGLQAACVILLIPLYCVLWVPADPRPMMLFLLAFLVMCAKARAAMAFSRKRGEPPVHSRYCGYPLLMKYLPWASELTVKKYIEPLAAILAGYFTLPFSQPLGLYWMIGGICIASFTSSAEVWERKRATDMHDAVIEQQQIADRFRSMRGEDF